MKRLVALFLPIFAGPLPLLSGEAVETAPSAPYERFIIYETLAIFWLAIIGLIIIIRMKLKEIERIREMDPDVDQKHTPFLD